MPKAQEDVKFKQVIRANCSLFNSFCQHSFYLWLQLTVIENILTHEVFKHGLLMSQQVINNGLPSNKANMTGQPSALDTDEIFVQTCFISVLIYLFSFV